MCSGYYKHAKHGYSKSDISECHPQPQAFWYPQELSWQDGLLALDYMKSRTGESNTQGRVSIERSRGEKSPLLTCNHTASDAAQDVIGFLGHKQITGLFKIIISAQNCSSPL